MLYILFSFVKSITLSKLTVSLRALRCRLSLWNSALPNIRPHYAVKCNNMAPILAELQRGGVGFDCASVDEINRVKKVGADDSDIIYANPCKSSNELFRIRNHTIPYMTFDSLSELIKITEKSPTTKPILRIFVDDKGDARIPLNKKFGFRIRDIDELLPRETRARIYGIAFHVGSDCTSVRAYQSAFDTVKEYIKVFKHRKDIFTPELLDIGGGFSGSSEHNDFFKYELAPVIQENVSSLPFKRTIAEPGRFFASEICTLHVPVIGRKRGSITLDESVYGIFSGVLFDGFKPTFKCISRTPYTHLEKFTIFGRTCDSADVIANDVWLPKEIGESDILEVKNIGAYSWVSASEFNGFQLPEVNVCENACPHASS